MKWHKLFEINLFSTPIIQLLDSSTVDFSPSAIERCQSAVKSNFKTATWDSYMKYASDSDRTMQL